MEGIRRLFVMAVTAVVVAVPTVGCGGNSEPDPKPQPPDPGPPSLVLERAPRVVREACRKIAADADTTVYCPTRLPPPVHRNDRWIQVKESRNIAGDAVVGVSILYTAEKQPALQNDFIHMYFFPTSILSDLPSRSRPAEFAGRRGTFYPATGHAPQNNHFNFSCRLGTRDETWVSVHSVGRGSRELLDAMVRELRPVEA